MPRVTAPKPKSLPLPLPVVAPPSSVVQYKPPTFGQAIKEGFGVGIGVSLANRVVSGIFGPPTVHVNTTQTPTVTTTNPTVTAFEQCIAEHRDDIGACAHLARSPEGGPYPEGGQSDIKK